MSPHRTANLLVPSPVLGEIGYLLQSRVGPHAEATFLKSFGGNGFHVAEVEGRSRLPDVQPGHGPPDDHPLDLRGALEDGEVVRVGFR